MSEHVDIWTQDCGWAQLTGQSRSGRGWATPGDAEDARVLGEQLAVLLVLFTAIFFLWPQWQN